MKYGRPVSLNRVLLGATVIIGAVAVGAMVTTVVMTARISRALAGDVHIALTEERIADRLLGAAQAQQLAALEYARTGDAVSAERFRRQGGVAFDAVRAYLHLPMPVEARIQVEAVKEAHERFEVAALRAFQGIGESAQATIATRATELSRAVDAFTALRHVQHRRAAELQEGRVASLQATTLGLAALVVALCVTAALVLRRIVLRPLRDVAQAARSLGAGDESAQVPPQAFTEFTHVAQSFNQMAVNLRNARRDLVQHEKLSAMGEMLAGLAHELNNPLAAILAASEVLEGELSTPSGGGSIDAATLRSELATPIVKEAKRARALVRNLLNLSRRSDDTLTAIDIGPVVRDAIVLRERAFQQRGRTIDVTVPDGMFVIADPTRLQVAIVNLLNNALDALDERGSSVVVGARPVDDMVELIVKDDGPGFDDPLRVFEPFFTTKPVGKGTGLGLALVHRFVQDVRGTVHAENVPGGGAMIRIRLPIAPGLTSAGSRASSAHDASSVGIHDKPVVLVVDDEETMRQLQTRLLRRLGADVVLAESGTEAKRLLAAHRVDLVISDVRMPGDTDGLALMQWMRDRFPRLASSALLMSGNVQFAESDGVRIDADRLLAKPFEVAEYMSRVGVALRRARGGGEVTSDSSGNTG